MKKTLSLALCVVCVLMFSAYDWGKKSKSQEETPSNTGTTLKASPAKSTTSKNATSKNATSKKAVSTAKDTASAQVSSPASDKALAISTLAKIVGSGTPEERKARMDSLKRVSQALAQSQAQNQTPTKKTR